MDYEKNYQQCLEKLVWATEQLKVEVCANQLAQIAKLIVQTMTGPWRYFHSTEHIFAVGGAEDAIEVLAALFHDIVYVQVDGSINFNLTYYLAPFIEEDREQLLIREQREWEPDSTVERVIQVFGFVPGQPLSPLSGQNEFLSAVVAAKVLETFLDPALIVQISACIEATIPFRPQSDGLSPSELLYQRLQSINQQFNLQISEAEISQAVQRSVRVANRDVYSFANPIPAVFLASTWSLLPETNHNLQKSGSYTVRDYRIALQKMFGFMNFLQPELVFRRFQGEPDDQTYYAMVERARKNLKVGRLYLESKLVAIAILEALSLRIGSDVSLTLMMGELPDSGVSIGSLKDSFPEISHPYQPITDIEEDVLYLLEVGRSDNPTYDLKMSPLTTFVVKFIGFDEIRRLREPVKAFFQRAISSEDFLAACNTDIIRMVSEGVSILLENRKVALSCSWQPLPVDFAKQSMDN